MKKILPLAVGLLGALTLPVLGLAGAVAGLVSGPAGGVTAAGPETGDTAIARPGPAGALAVAYALAQIGTPYRWGGEGPAGFDCSGLVQAGYRAAGVVLPRTAQEQYDAAPHLPAGSPLEPGDLVFFGSGPTGVSHVGLFVGSPGGRAFMVDAPHSGADVRVEPFPADRGAAWGGDIYVGAGRPGG